MEKVEMLQRSFENYLRVKQGRLQWISSWQMERG